MTAKPNDRLEGFSEDICSATRFQATNGVLSKEEANTILDKIKCVKKSVKNGACSESAMLELEKINVELHHILNNKPLKLRLIHIYGLPILIATLSHIVMSFLILTFDIYNLATKQIAGTGIRGANFFWGGLGAAAYVIYYLRKNIYTYQLAKLYQLYYFAYIVAGMAFGLGLAIVINAGILTVEGRATENILYGVSFMGGLLQHWVLSLIKSLAERLHKSETI